MKRPLRAALAIAGSLAVGVAAAQITIQIGPSRPDPVRDGRLWKTGYIVSANSGLCLAVQAGWGGEGSNVIQDTCGSAGTVWSLRDLGGREFAIINEDTGYALDVTRSSMEDGANVQQWGWNRTFAQRWRVENMGRDLVQIVNQGSGKCLDVEFRSRQPGANVQQYRCTGGANQLWQLRPAVAGGPALPGRPPAVVSPPVPPVAVEARPQGRLVYAGMIVSRATGKCVDVERSRREDGVNIRQWHCNGTDAQLWDVIDLGRGEHAIVSRASGKVMDVYGDYRSGANVAQQTWYGSAHQRWRIEPAGRGFSRFINVGSGKCLDLEGGRGEDGVNIQQYDCHGGENQQWRIEIRGSGPQWSARPDPNPVAGNLHQSWAEPPPPYAIGVFTAHAEEFGGAVELAVYSDGVVALMLPNRARMDGYFRNGELYLGFNRYQVEETGNGFRARAVGERAPPIQFRRVR
ncbi:MAG: RICIN domain-containing protein [Casimicrobiaceae bacterium]|nr:RICIN domain-containing protein [Casimicrobiaceae bacterium]MDW8312392.1 RICIN domain-containing protein [Burkholderiales bacterium]